MRVTVRKCALVLFFLLGATAFHPAQAQSGRWKNIASLSTPRAGLSVVSVRGRVYAIGGRDAQQNALDVAERYDPKTKRWERVASLQRARYNAAAVVWHEQVVVLGGRGPDPEDGEEDGDADDDVLDVAEIYDPAADEWRSFPALSQARAGAVAVNLNGDLYVLGGAKKSKEELLRSIERFDAKEEAWVETETTLPRPRAAMGTVSAGSTAFLMGGFVGSAVPLPTASILRFDPQKGITELNAVLPAAIGGVTAVFSKGNIYVIGGLGLSGVVRTVNVFRRKGKKMTLLQEKSLLNIPRTDAGAVITTDTVYVVGGQHSVNPSSVLASAESRMVTTTARTGPPVLSDDFALRANWPNPFRTRTSILFHTSRAAAGRPTVLRVYDALGRRVATLVDRRVLPPGPHRVQWDGTTGTGRSLASGTYVLRLQQGDLHTTRTLTLLR